MNLRIKKISLTYACSRLAIAALLFALLLSCTSRQETLKKKWEKNPCQQISYWGDRWKQTALTNRIKESPQELIEKVHIENEIWGFQERPTPIKPPSQIYSAMKSIEESLPKNIISILEKRFIGIFSVKELGGSGYADVVYDEEGNEHYALIILDADLLLNKKANEWATWKLNSTFRPEANGPTKISAVIEKEEDDNVVNAIRFILLHELGHILGVLTKTHSSWVEWYDNKKINMDYPFQKLSWRLTKDNKIVSLFDDEFPERRVVKVYSFEKSKLTNHQILPAYNNLIRHTNFPSLYATQSLWEDFAESFATYVHVVIDERPWQVIIQQDTGSKIVVESCWGDKRCEEKELFMQEWFSNPQM
jgi:hypothetical protein